MVVGGRSYGDVLRLPLAGGLERPPVVIMPPLAGKNPSASGSYPRLLGSDENYCWRTVGGHREPPVSGSSAGGRCGPSASGTVVAISTFILVSSPTQIQSELWLHNFKYVTL